MNSSKNRKKGKKGAKKLVISGNEIVDAVGSKLATDVLGQSEQSVDYSEGAGGDDSSFVFSNTPRDDSQSTGGDGMLFKEGLSAGKSQRSDLDTEEEKKSSDVHSQRDLRSSFTQEDGDQKIGTTHSQADQKFEHTLGSLRSDAPTHHESENPSTSGKTSAEEAEAQTQEIQRAQEREQEEKQALEQETKRVQTRIDQFKQAHSQFNERYNSLVNIDQKNLGTSLPKLTTLKSEVDTYALPADSDYPTDQYKATLSDQESELHAIVTNFGQLKQLIQGKLNEAQELHSNIEAERKAIESCNQMISSDNLPQAERELEKVEHFFLDDKLKLTLKINQIHEAREQAAAEAERLRIKQEEQRQKEVAQAAEKLRLEQQAEQERIAAQKLKEEQEEADRIKKEAEAERIKKEQEAADQLAKQQAEAKRVAEAAIAAENKKKADEAEAKRKADEAEEKRKADEAKKKADEAEAKRKADEAEAKRKADEAEAKRKADEAETKKKAEAAAAEEQQRQQAKADEQEKIRQAQLLEQAQRQQQEQTHTRLQQEEEERLRILQHQEERTPSIMGGTPPAAATSSTAAAAPKTCPFAAFAAKGEQAPHPIPAATTTNQDTDKGKSGTTPDDAGEKVDKQDTTQSDKGDNSMFTYVALGVLVAIGGAIAFFTLKRR